MISSWCYRLYCIRLRYIIFLFNSHLCCSFTHEEHSSWRNIFLLKWIIITVQYLIRRVIGNQRFFIFDPILSIWKTDVFYIKTTILKLRISLNTFQAAKFSGWGDSSDKFAVSSWWNSILFLELRKKRFTDFKIIPV